MFDLKRPCVNCPFRKGQGSLFQLSEDRLTEIFNAPAFQCHKTVNYDDSEDGEARAGDRPQQCAGLMTVLHREKTPNQIMQVAQRLSGFNAADLDPDGHIYASIDDVLDAHLDGQEPA